MLDMSLASSPDSLMLGRIVVSLKEDKDLQPLLHHSKGIFPQQLCINLLPVVSLKVCLSEGKCLSHLPGHI